MGRGIRPIHVHYRSHTCQDRHGKATFAVTHVAQDTTSKPRGHTGLAAEQGMHQRSRAAVLPLHQKTCRAPSSDTLSLAHTRRHRIAFREMHQRTLRQQLQEAKPTAPVQKNGASVVARALQALALLASQPRTGGRRQALGAHSDMPVARRHPAGSRTCPGMEPANPEVEPDLPRT